MKLSNHEIRVPQLPTTRDNFGNDIMKVIEITV